MAQYRYYDMWVWMWMWMYGMYTVDFVDINTF